MNYFRGRLSYSDLASLDMNTINTLSKVKHDEEKREERENEIRAKQGKQKQPTRQEAEMIEDAISGNL